MIINKSFKVEIKPNNKQKTLLNKSCGVARATYNWGLEQRIELYKNEKKSTTYYQQDKFLNSIKQEQFPWMMEVSKCCRQESLKDLDSAYKNFFRRVKSGKGKPGFPKFKRKSNDESFRITGIYNRTCTYFYNNFVNIPKIGKVRLKQKGYIPLSNVKYNNMTVSKHLGRWYVSVSCEVEIPDIIETPKTILGIDLGLKELAVCSNGISYANNKYMKKAKKQLAHAQKNQSRKVKGSRNFNKAVKKVQEIYNKINNKRKDNLNKMTTELARTKPRFIVMEDLNVEGMLQNHKLAGAISDASFNEIKRQLQYKTSWYGGEVIEVDRFFPSSKTCSNCGTIKEDLTLADRTYTCDCGLVIDRDLNAAINLEKYGLSTLGSRGIKACGENIKFSNKFLQDDSVGGLEVVSTNQEINSKVNALQFI